MTKYSVAKLVFAALALSAGASPTYAGAVIVNPSDSVALGINDDGSLNYSGGPLFSSNAGAVGLSIIKDGSLFDATAPGCLCEGWGVSGNGVAGYANVSTDGGANNLTIGSFTSTASTAVSKVSVTSLPQLTVSQNYFPAPEAAGILFQDKVTITNTGLTTISDVRYVRVMDWDIPPTEFSEIVTVKGTMTTSLLAVSHDNGFSTANPLATTTALDPSTTDPITNKKDFDHVGPADHGAYFNFHFGDLAPGKSEEFSIYYGAAFSEKSMLAALGAVGVELYSLGESSTVDGPTLGTPYTFGWGFSGVGGTIVLPPPGPGAVPEPSTYGITGGALLGIMVLLRRRRLAKLRSNG